MTDLATRCEQAEGPDRALDAEIARSLGWGCVMQDPQAGLKWFCWKEFYRSGEWISLPNYTASLDAAITLYSTVPDRVPSCPRKACAEALRAHAKDQADVR